MNLKKIDYDYVPVNLIKNGGEQFNEDFREKNPGAEVPLIKDGSISIGQSLAIISYLEEQYPEPRLFPESPLKRAECIEFCEIINSGIQPLQNLRVLNYLQNDLQVSDEEKLKWINHWVQRGLQVVEQKLVHYQNDFCIDKVPTVADAFLVPQVYSGLRFNVSLDEFPRIREIYERCLEIDAFKKAAPENQIDAQL